MTSQHLHIKHGKEQELFQEFHKAAVYLRNDSISPDEVPILLIEKEKNEFIRRNTLWRLAGIYCDTLSGTLNGFEKMKADAIDGILDLVIIKDLMVFDKNYDRAMDMVRQLQNMDHPVALYVEDLKLVY